MSESESYVDQDIQRFYGKYRGVVDDNTPDELGCIRVTCASVLGKESFLAMPCVPYAGAGVGFRFLPENGDNVWIEFEGGDPSWPIWSGCFWKAKDFPRVKDAPNIKIIKTAKVTIEIDDDAGSIKIEHANGTVFEIKGSDISSVADGKITQQVKTMTTTLDVTKFDVHNGAMTIA